MTRMHSTDITGQTACRLAGYDTSPESPSIAAARRLMTAALGYRGPQEAQRLAIAEALAVLSDVVPPYPAPPRIAAVAPSTDLFELTQLILEHLKVALDDEVVEIIELTRVATASIVLRRGGGVAA